MPIGNFNLPNPSQLRTAGGYASPTGGGGMGASPSAMTGVPGQPDPLPVQQRYRQDAGHFMTDADYTGWQQQQPINALKAQTGIATDAQSRLGKEQAGYDTGMETQKENFATQQAKAEADFASQAAIQKEQLGEKAFNSRSSALSGLMGSFAGGVGSNGQGGGNFVAPIQPDVAGETAAQNTALARAKDIAGSTGRAALNSLQDVMGGRGITGSGLAANGAGGVINQAAGQIGDVNRGQLIQAMQLARERASQNYTGQIAQRGQNLGAMSGLIGALGSGISY